MGIVKWFNEYRITPNFFKGVFLVLGVAMSLVILAYVLSGGSRQEQPDKLLPYNFEIAKKDLLNSTNGFDLKITMLSRTFSADSPIHVKVNAEQRNGTDVKHLYVIFPRSHYVGDKSVEDYSDGGWISLSNPINRTFPAGETDIQYQMQGCYNVVVTTEIGRAHNIYRPDSCSEINIASLEATYAYNANKISTALALENLQESKFISIMTILIAVFTAVTFLYQLYDFKKPESGAKKRGKDHST